MCGANSEDARVQTAVKQIVKLAGTIEPGAPLEHNLFLPCLIVGLSSLSPSLLSSPSFAFRALY